MSTAFFRAIHTQSSAEKIFTLEVYFHGMEFHYCELTLFTI